MRVIRKGWAWLQVKAKLRQRKRKIEFLVWRAKFVGFYFRKYDPLTAIRIIIRARRSRGKGPLLIKGIEHPLFLRTTAADLYVFEEIFIRDEYKLPFRISPRLIIDVGANVGFSSVYFSNYYPNSCVVAVEPVDENFRQLRLNTARYPNIRVLQAALWSSSTHLRIENPEVEPWEYRMEETSPDDPQAHEGAGVGPRTGVLLTWGGLMLSII